MKPTWLKAKIPSGANYHGLKKLFRDLNLHTVCEEAQCPNIGDCWDRKTATVMIMGDTCTRACGFCAVNTGRPKPLDICEPQNVAQALAQLNLQHVVITSVDRDDLPDGGSHHFAQTIQEVKKVCPNMTLEVLIPDFRGQREDLNRVFAASPDILNHNLETIARLQKHVRPQAHYERSLKVLSLAAEAGLVAKSGIMVGLGETFDEIEQTLCDLYQKGKISILTVGQYLQPGPQNLKVERFYSPQEFAKIRQMALDIGIPEVASSTFVRSSYHADVSASKLSMSLRAAPVIPRLDPPIKSEDGTHDAECGNLHHLSSSRA
ncbi:MAG: lipoyl synthase [Deltaproteobacteria bacterium]|nr:lipoyl synthase [Deltaproteobacteria bacterium]